VVAFRRVGLAQSTIDVLNQLDDPEKARKVKRLCEDVFSELCAKGDGMTGTMRCRFAPHYIGDRVGHGGVLAHGTNQHLRRTLIWTGSRSAPDCDIGHVADSEKTKIYLECGVA